MDVLLLGGAAVVLIAITLWIVFSPSSPTPEPSAAGMPPQGDVFEDQYTSATADLSAGAVAITEAAAARTAAEPERPRPLSKVEQPRALATVAREPVLALPPPRRELPSVGIGAALLMTVAGALGGAFFYARWQRERNKPLNRLKRWLM